MPGRTAIVHPALDAVHGVIVVCGSVYPAPQARISCVPADCGVDKPIQLTPLYELTFKRWLNPTGLLPVPPGLPIPCAQCGQLAEGLEEWQLLTVNTFEKSALPEPMIPDQMYFASDPLLRK